MAREALLVAQDLAAKGDPSELKQSTPDPRATPITFQVEGRPYSADLYCPGVPPLGGVVLIPGAEQRGIDNPMIVSLATRLARARFSVLVPSIPGLDALRVRPDDVGQIADAFAFALSCPAHFPSGHTGLASISYSVGPTILAAMQPRLRDQVAFVVGVGGYYDLREAIAFFTTGAYEVDGRWHHMDPHPYGKWVFAQSMADELPARDRAAFEKMVHRKLDHPAASVADLAANLGPEGIALYQLIRNERRQRVGALIDRLPIAIQRDLVALNLARMDLSRLQAPVILLHSREDDIIPYSQSLALHRALPQSRVYLADFGHVEFEKLDREDFPTMLGAIEAVLTRRMAPRERLQTPPGRGASPCPSSSCGRTRPLAGRPRTRPRTSALRSISASYFLLARSGHGPTVLGCAQGGQRTAKFGRHGELGRTLGQRCHKTPGARRNGGDPDDHPLGHLASFFVSPAS